MLNDNHLYRGKASLDHTPVDRNEFCLYDEHCSPRLKAVLKEGGQIAQLPGLFQDCSLKEQIMPH
jgi:hypothetical protein